MKTNFKKQIETLTNGKYKVVFEGKEKLLHNWLYYIIYDLYNDVYYAAVNNQKDINARDIRKFDTYIKARNYIAEFMIK